MSANPQVAQLFDAFVEAHVSGERPDVRDYLGRAGAAHEQLGLLIDRYLAIAPVAEPDAETIVAIDARLGGMTPLEAARRRVPLKLDELVERLRGALGLGEQARAKLALAYRELEADELDPWRVDDRVWEALRPILGVDPRRLRPREEPLMLLAGSFDLSAAAQPDEVDQLFGRG